MFRLLAVFLVAALVGAGAGLWLHNGLTRDLEAASVPSEISSTGDFTPAGGLSPANGIMAVDCDASAAGVQTTCTYPPGGTFQVEIHVLEPPDGGYAGFWAKLRWDDAALTYLPATRFWDEMLWLPCALMSRLDNQPLDPSALWRCVTKFAGSVTLTGAILRLEFQCGTEPTANVTNVLGKISEGVNSPLTLVPRSEDPDLDGTFFIDSAITRIDPALIAATVSCSADLDEDSDGDGCTDAQELGSNPARGGQRSPNSFWDFFDTPDAANVRDRAITIADIGRVVGRFGTSGTLPLSLEEQVQAALSPPPPAGYHPAFDRTPGSEVWRTGPPSGGVTIQDVGLIVAQFGHTCVQ